MSRKFRSSLTFCMSGLVKKTMFSKKKKVSHSLSQKQQSSFVECLLLSAQYCVLPPLLRECEIFWVYLEHYFDLQFTNANALTSYSCFDVGCGYRDTGYCFDKGMSRVYPKKPVLPEKNCHLPERFGPNSRKGWGVCWPQYPWLKRPWLREVG